MIYIYMCNISATVDYLKQIKWKSFNGL